jgi:hypothetical protein
VANIPTQTIDDDGTVVSFQAAAAGGDKASPGYGNVLEVINAHATLSRTVTLVTPITISGLPVDNRTLVVAALTTGRIHLKPPDIYTGTDGLMDITYSDAAANLTVAVTRAG